MNPPPHDSESQRAFKGDSPRRPSSGSELDRLLDLDARPGSLVPEGLGKRVLHGLREREERALDALLEMARDDIEIPQGLTQRVVAASRPAARREETLAARRGLRWLPGGTLPRAALGAAAALVVAAVGLGLWSVYDGARAGISGEENPDGRKNSDALIAEASPAEDEPVHGVEDAVDPELLAVLAVLERWDYVAEAVDGEALSGQDSGQESASLGSEEDASDPTGLNTLAGIDEGDELLLLMIAEEQG